MIEFRIRVHFDLSRLKPCSPKSRWVFKVRAVGNSEKNSNERKSVGGNGAEEKWRWIQEDDLWEDYEKPSMPFLLLFSRYCDLLFFV